jgi:siroheme synthase-like protein
MDGKTALIFGGGTVSERKVKNFLQEGSKVIVVSKSFTAGLRELGEQGRTKLVEVDLETNFPTIASLISKSHIVLATTDNTKLNSDIANESKKRGVLVCAVDRPSISDFFQPAVVQVGSIRAGVCTDGKSPIMAGILRKRVEEIITREDVLHVELQSYARKLAKIHIPDRSSRRGALYQIIRDPEINHLLREDDLEEAKNRAKQIIENHQLLGGGY